MLHFSRMKSLINPSTLSKPTPFAPLLFSLPTKSICFSANPTTLLNPIPLPLKPLTLSPKPSFFRCLQSRASSHFPPSPSPGKIHVIVGPMFSGKTTTLLRRVQAETSDGSFQVKHLLQLDRTLKNLCLTGRVSEAVRLLWCKGVAVNHGTYALLLQDCIFWKQFNRGRRIHAQMAVVGYVPNEYLKTKLLILYAKSGDLKTAHVLFHGIEKTIISWNAMISGYVQNGFEKMGLSLYYRMRETGLTPDQYTFASVFRACATLASLEHGKQAHAVMIKCFLRENVVITSALVDMYFKCSHLCDGHKVFDKSLNRNVVTWTSLISGYGHHGSVTEVLKSFHRMKDEGCQPNYVTFLAVLSACSHGGLIDDGWNYFLSMKNDHGIQPRGQHYAVMVDLLGRAGRLKEAYELVVNSPYDEHSVIWGALLNACRIHGDMDLLKIITKKYFELDPKNSGKYVVLSNAYATFGFWDNVEEVRKTMRDIGMVKEPAYSSIEIQREVHFFLMGDQSHQNSEEIYKMLFKLTYILNDTGFVPD